MHRFTVRSPRSRRCRLLVLAAAACPLAVGCSMSLVESKPEVLRYCRVVAVHASSTGPSDARSTSGARPAPDARRATGAQAGSTSTTPCMP